MTPSFALHELQKYEEEIEGKMKIDKKGFAVRLQDLGNKLTFIPLERYRQRVVEAAAMIDDPDDIDFVALALAFRVPLWTHDKLLYRVKGIRIVGIQDLLKMLRES